jgi:PDZ domain-containing protein
MAGKRGLRRLGGAVIALVALIGVAGFYRPPVATFAPGPAVDVAQDISIAGVPADRPTGRYLLVAVSVQQPNALGALRAALDPNQELIPLSALIPEGVSRREFLREQKSLFSESQRMAAAAAATAAGLDVSVSGRGAQIVGLSSSSSVKGVLRAGDVVTAVDGAPIGLAPELRSVISARPPGTRFELSVEREGAARSVQVTSGRLAPRDGGGAGIGVLVATRDLSVKLPFEIEFRERDIGGPSAGLAYALAIEDMLNPRDLARGRTIAASGTIRLDGDVGPVGGLREKRESARRAGASLLLVPLEEAGEVGGGRLPVRGVDTLRDALSVLES